MSESPPPSSQSECHFGRHTLRCFGEREGWRGRRGLRVRRGWRGLDCDGRVAVGRRAVAELADVARQREAGLVVLELDLAPLRLHADDLEGQHPCARDRISELAILKGDNAFWNRITHPRGHCR